MCHVYILKITSKNHLSCHKPHCSLDDDSGHDHERWGQLPLEKVTHHPFTHSFTYSTNTDEYYKAPRTNLRAGLKRHKIKDSGHVRLKISLFLYSKMKVIPSFYRGEDDQKSVIKANTMIFVTCKLRIYENHKMFVPLSCSSVLYYCILIFMYI